MDVTVFIVSWLQLICTVCTFCINKIPFWLFPISLMNWKKIILDELKNLPKNNPWLIEFFFFHFDCSKENYHFDCSQYPWLIKPVEMHVRAHKHTHKHMHMYTLANTCIHVRTHKHVCVCVCVWVCVSEWEREFMYVCKCVYNHTTKCNVIFNTCPPLPCQAHAPQPLPPTNT